MTQKAPFLNIIFFGTPDFAMASLKALFESDFPVLAVVTAPDKPAGRGRKIMPSAVKTFAETHHIPILQPKNLKNPDFLKELENFNADLYVVVAFRMLPEKVWNMPPMGTINVHASLLPQYRGAAPINHAIINGETKTGITIFKLKQEIDTGNLLLQEKVAISPEDNFGSMYEKLKDIGSKLLIKTIDKIVDKSIQPIPQEIVENLQPAPKIFRKDCLINWTEEAKRINDFIRGLSPYPGAFTFLEDKKIKILSANYSESSHNLQPGLPDTDNKSYLKIATSNGWVEINTLQPEGKKVTSVRDFLNGHQLKKPLQPLR